VTKTPNIGIDRMAKRRRFACCLGAGHAGRWASTMGIANEH